MGGSLSFLSSFGRSVVPGARATAWFPVVGLAIGLAVGELWWGALRAFPALVAAAIVVVGDAVLTGGLHLDGLADTADGLLAPMSRQRRLEVMRDPTVGAFGALALSVVLLVRFAVFATASPAPILVAAMWGLSRAGMALTMRLVPYARPGGGLADVFRHDPRNGAASVGVLTALGLGVAACVALAVVSRQLHGLASLGATGLVFAAVVLFALRRLGGYTGDVLGAAGVIGETAGLLVLAARWT